MSVFCCNQISLILLTPKTCLFCCKVQCSEQKADQTTGPCWAKSPCCLCPISHFGISYLAQIQIHRSSWPDNGAVLSKEPVPAIPDFCKLSTFLLHVFHSWLASWFFPLQQRHFLLLDWKGDPCLWGTKCRWIKFRYFRGFLRSLIFCYFQNVVSWANHNVGIDNWNEIWIPKGHVWRA